MTHKFGDESGASPPPTHPAAWTVCVAAADNYGLSRPAQTHTHIASVPWFRMPESVRITAGAPPQGGGGQLFVAEHHRVSALNKPLLCNLTLSRLIALTRSEVKSNR